LVKLGLLPYGAIRGGAEGDATLTFNAVNRHVAAIVKIRVTSINSPWLSGCRIGEEYLVPVSHGEGRFTACGQHLRVMEANGQIATRYAGENPNGSALGIEGVISADGLIYGKMGHAERTGKNLFKNAPGNYNMPLFTSGVKYFK
jgi:phosphoribosylformylglycinamidine synthase